MANIQSTVDFITKPVNHSTTELSNQLFLIERVLPVVAKLKWKAGNHRHYSEVKRLSILEQTYYKLKEALTEELKKRNHVPSTANQKKKKAAKQKAIPKIPNSAEERRKIAVVRRKLRYEFITRPGESNIREALLSSKWNTDRAFTKLLKQFKGNDRKSTRNTVKQAGGCSADALKKSGYSTTQQSKRRDAHQLTAIENKLNDLQKMLTATIAELKEFTRTAGERSEKITNEQAKKIGKKKTVTRATKEKLRKTKPTVVDLNFEVLPPGQWQTKDIITYYKNLERRNPEIFQSGQVQWDRIRAIWKLEPQRAFRGKSKWLGYVVYDFKYTKNVILECAIEGNAVYILKGNSWKKLILFSKGEIRDDHKKSYRKVVHKNDWLSRVKTALHDL